MKTYQFKWQGFDRQNTPCKGIIECQYVEQAYQQLKAKHITISQIKKRTHFISRAISTKEITQLTEQLVYLVDSGIALVPALTILSQNHVRISPLIHQIIDQLNQGKRFSTALMQFPQYFDSTYRQFVITGENTGKFAYVLKLLAQHRTQQQQQRTQLRAALSYPIIMGSTTCLIVIGLIYGVVPSFQSILDHFSGKLPAPTLFLLKLSEIITQYGMLLLSLFLGVTMILYKTVSLPERYWLYIQRIFFKTPLSGQIFTTQIIAQWTGMLAIQLHAGISLSEALFTMKKTARYLLLRRITQTIYDMIHHGKRFADAIEQSNFFPKTFTAAIFIAEESSLLAETLSHLAKLYENEHQRLMQSLIRFCEPLFILFLGTIMEGVILLLYLPIIRLGQII